MIYFMFKITIYSVCFISTMAISQRTVFDDPYGFLKITSDSSNVPVYIDGNLIGHTPIDKTIPLIVGNHYIDIKPLSISNPFSQHGPLRSSKNIYVFRNDTAHVILNPYDLQMRSERRVKEKLYTNYIGFGLGILTILQIWIITG